MTNVTSLEDCEIIKVFRAMDSIEIELIQPSGKKVLVRASGVKFEEVTFYDGKSAHREPSDIPIPLNRVEVASLERGLLSLEGYRNSIPWYAWRITSPQLRIEEEA